jgi:uncharacterized membrane protein YkvA (DUF1232 family)
MAKQRRSMSDPDLLGRLWNNMVLSWRLLFDRRVSGMAKMIPLAMIAYILSPIDLIPDIFLPFGVVDDIGALVLGLQFFIHSAPPEVVNEYRRRVRGKTRPDEPKVIEGHYEVRDEDN